MYNDHVTVFNFYESPTTGEITWYPHVLQMCNLIVDRGAALKQYGPNSTDAAQLHIKWYNDAESPDSEDIKILENSGAFVTYVGPTDWKKQTNDMLPKTITFSDKDFFMRGKWTGPSEVSEDDYRNGFYQYMNSNRDDVYKISSVGGPYPAIQHFEILGK